jgi:hypothetical protein
MAYATRDELLERLPEASSSVDGTILDGLLEQASAVVDRLTGDTYAAAGDEAADRVIYGSGTPYLYVGPTAEAIVADDVTMPSGYTVPAFAVSGYYLRTTDASGIFSDFITWPSGVPVTISALWGAATVPPDIKAATLSLAVEWFRRRGVAFVEGYTGSIGQSSDVPREVRDILLPRLAGHSLRTAI